MLKQNCQKWKFRRGRGRPWTRIWNWRVTTSAMLMQRRTGHINATVENQHASPNACAQLVGEKLLLTIKLTVERLHCNLRHVIAGHCGSRARELNFGKQKHRKATQISRLRNAEFRTGWWRVRPSGHNGGTPEGLACVELKKQSSDINSRPLEAHRHPPGWWCSTVRAQ